MGAADIVPGVSGGTVALVLGIYRLLINALHQCVSFGVSLVKGQFAEAGRRFRALPLLWMAGLGVGILATVFTLSGPLESALHDHPVELAGLFTGLIAAAVVLCWRQIDRATGLCFVLAGVFAAVTYLLLGISPVGEDGAVNSPWWVFFLSGAVAICAMILPGISGSFLLVVMGMYAQVIAAVADRDFVVLAVFALGCATGLALASSALNWLLLRYHDLVLAAMIGLMVGSIRILWPWPNGLDSTEMALPGQGEIFVPVLLAVAGFAVVLIIDAVADRIRQGD